MALGARGQRLWDAATKARPSMNEGDRVLLKEACRLADRLDRLAGLLDGDEAVWARVEVPERGDDAELVIDQALGAARLHAATLAGLVKQLALPEGVAESGPKEGIGDDPLAAARAARADRLSRAAGS